MTIVMTFNALSWAADKTSIVVPFPPGGTNDILGRYVANVLEKNNQPAVVINKGGAGGVIGVKHAMEIQSNNDTLLMISGGPGLYAPNAMDPVPYDIRKDFEFVALLGRDDAAIVVPTTSKIQNTPDLVRELKANPGKLTFAYTSLINKFSGVMFLNQVGATATGVSYDGGPKGRLAVGGGHVDFGMFFVVDAIALAETGKGRIIGIASQARHPSAADVRTFKEQGIDFVHYSWYGVLAGKDMPSHKVKEISAQLVAAVEKDNENPILNNVLAKDPRSGEKFREFVNKEFDIWVPVIQKNK